MNKILVSRDKIITNSDSVLIDGNVVKLLVSGIYTIEYNDVEDIELCIYVDGNVDAVLYESSFLDRINVNNRYVVKNGTLRVNKFYDTLYVDEVIDIDLLCEYSNKIK